MISLGREGIVNLYFKKVICEDDGLERRLGQGDREEAVGKPK